MKQWRLLTGEASGAMNMAIDQALLKLKAEGKSPPTLRLYKWKPSAVSLGYFQRKQGPNPEACERLGLDVVRRPSGGRAVLHLGDLTYAVIAGTRDSIPFDADGAYRLISKGLVIGLNALGVTADSYDGNDGASLPTICFLHPASGEIVWQGKKFVGNAQAWSGQTLLQHGSIAIEPQIDYLTELFKPERYPLDQFRAALSAKVTSINEIMGRAVSSDLVGEAIRNGMGEALGVTFEPGELSPEESDLAEQLSLRPAEELTRAVRRRA
ncbi:MAG: biotin/lipoate A/B protein ligase family protein [Desulfomonilaceae bacterium]